jgi:hypothetical protein
MGKLKKSFTNQSLAEKARDNKNASLYRKELIYSHRPNSMFIVDWQLREEKQP